MIIANILPVGVALLAHAVEGRACTTMESPAERGWRLGRLHAQQHRSNVNKERKGTSAGGSSTVGKADSAAEK